MTEIETIFKELIQSVSKIPEVQSIGRSGGRELPKSSKDGDIDIFLYCNAIPPEETRRAALISLGGKLGDTRMTVYPGGRWGVADFVDIRGVETWLMYFTTQEALAEVESYLNGEHPGREGGFYPTGRLAMYLTMDVLLDRTGFLAGMKKKLSVYPPALSEKLTKLHLEALGYTEDFERALARKDPLYYHFAMEPALDHFLQALFAMNHVYFPSRKRTLEYIEKFAVKPERCGEKLLEVVKLGGDADGLAESYRVWEGLVGDLKRLDH